MRSPDSKADILDIIAVLGGASLIVIAFLVWVVATSA